MGAFISQKSAMTPPSRDSSGCSRQAVIINELGLHARSAVKIVALAAKAVHGVWLSADDQEVDATSTIDILSLYRPKGSALTIRIKDPVDRPVLDAICQLIENGFGE